MGQFILKISRACVINGDRYFALCSSDRDSRFNAVWAFLLRRFFSIPATN